MEERIRIAEEIASYLRKSRYNSKKSQEYMAMGIGVSKKTIQNWENGTSCPSYLQLVEWFRLIKQNPLPFFLNISIPEQYKKVENDENMDEILDMLIHQLPSKGKEILLYLLDGEHGGSQYAILQMLIAHLQTPLKDRVINATIIGQNYEMNKQLGKLNSPNKIQPDVILLMKSIEEGKKSASQSQPGYFPNEKDIGI